MSPSTSQRALARLFALSGLAMIAGGVLAGVLVDPILFVIAAVGIVDMAVARLYASGRLGRAADQADANPYARED